MYKNQTNVILLEFVKVQCSHLDSLIMWQMVRTKGYPGLSTFLTKNTSHLLQR